MSQTVDQGGGNRQAGILATVLVSTILATFTVALRMVTRIRLVRIVGWDDYTIVCATLGHIFGLVVVFIQVHYGFGLHGSDLTTRQYTQFGKYSYAEWIQTFQTLMFTKLSICFLLLRIPIQNYLKRPIQGAVAVLVVTNIVLTLLWILQCNPAAGAWNKEIPAKCFTDAQLLRIIISQAIISIVSDIVLALSPIVLLWKVQIGRRVKVGLCTLMGLGVVTAICCTIRTVLNGQNVNADVTWRSVTNWQWRSWEVGLGIIAASIPTLRPGFKFLTSSIDTFLSRRRFFSRGTPSGDVYQQATASFYFPPAASSFSRRLLHRFKIPDDHSGSLAPPTAAAAARDGDTANLGHARMSHGAGDDDDRKSFAMDYLPGDQQMLPPAMRKVAGSSDRSFLESASLESGGGGGLGEGCRDFV
ncbi:MAG: hypothetical protein LQ348_001507 [Seirophora lacunosa]|nr:MAG: hypothetical protein LQ348_001507 [Seirophora lacunosa]